MKRIAILGASRNQYGCYLQAKKLGYYIVGIASEEGAVAKEFCDEFYPVSFAEKDVVLEICKKTKIDGITSFTLESALPTLIYVATNLGLVSNSEACLERIATKYTQREAFKEAGLNVPKYMLVKSSVEKIVCKYPLIVKPVDSGGSKAVRLVKNEDELCSALSDAIGCSRSRSAIVEEYIDGREFSVEYLSYKGQHYLCQVTDKVTSGAPLFVEMEHHQPADVTEEQKRLICLTVEAGLSALGIENSASHTEIKMNSKGELYIIEIGARMGGDKITERLVELSTGIDFVGEVLKLACGDFEVPKKIYEKHSGVFFYSQLAPYVGDVFKNRSNYSWVIEAEKTDNRLTEVHSNADRAGYVLYQSNKRETINHEK